MSELNNTESQVTDTAEVSEITPSEQVEVTEKIKGYQNKTARLLNNVFMTMLVAAIIYVGFQFYLTHSSYVMQGASVSLAVLYSLASVLMPAILIGASAFLFKFFAEVIELMDKNRK